MRRSAVGSFVTSLRRCVVAMEACCGAHHLGRVFAAVRLMSPEYVRPYVKAQKNDDLDAEAIAEAASRPTMRFVEVKPGSIGHLGATSRARTAGVGAHRADQPFTRFAAGAWDRGAAGPAQIGRTAFDFRG
jgi:transposase